VGRAGGEIYGGDLFLKSAAMDTLQGKAIQAANERWGDLSGPNAGSTDGSHNNRTSEKIVSKKRLFGRKGSNDVYIGMPVCKKKYTPFAVKWKFIEPLPSSAKKVAVHIIVERMYGCSCHSQARRKMILKHGERQGWEPFGQWSIAKAQAAAIKHVKSTLKKGIDTARLVQDKESTDDACDSKFTATGIKYESLCRNGECLWKKKDDYDDIDDEIQSTNDSLDANYAMVINCSPPKTDLQNKKSTKCAASASNSTATKRKRK